MADEGRSRSSLDRKTSYSEDKDGAGNKFANDGSFMAMFRKQMEDEKTKKKAGQSNSRPESSAAGPDTVQLVHRVQQHHDHDHAVPESSRNSDQQGTNLTKKAAKPLPFVGKRRGTAPVLKTGAVKKTKREEDEDKSTKKDGWAQYLAEVKKYKEQSCQEENKTRPLVK